MYYSNVPKIFDLLKVFVPKKKPNLINKIYAKNNTYKIYSRSSWSIFAFCKSVIIQKKRKINLAVPSYYCDYALHLINRDEVNIIYYNTNDDVIDLKKIKLINDKIDILISVNYFGKKCTDANVFDYCKSKNIYLIEDSTQCIVPPSSREYGDIILYSPYKFIGSLFGAILIINSKGPNQIHSNFLDKGLSGIGEKHKKRKIITLDFIRWLLKKIIQNFFKVKIKIEDFQAEKKFVTRSDESIYLDYFTEKFLISQIYKIYSIIDVRKKSFLIWQCLFQKFNIKNSELIFKKNFNSYLFIIEDKYDQIIELYNYLKENKLPVSTWPDLNKKIKIDKQNYANYLRRTRLCLPIHSLKNKNYISLLNNKFNDKQNNLNLKKNNFKINKIDKVNYLKNLKNVDYINLLQTVQHFIAKKKLNFFLKAQYYEITFSGKIVGIFQLIYVKLFFLELSLLNRGPLFIKNTTLAHKEEIIINIQNYFKKKKFHMMFFMPELILEDIKNLTNYSLLKFIGRNSWNTKIINLNDNLDNIKKNFSSKIRNKLNQNIKEQNMEIRKIQNFDELLKLINLLEIDQKKKNYKGLNKKYIISLYNQNCIYSYIALKNKTVLGGVIVSAINDTATYLSGYFNKSFNMDSLSYRLLFLAITESKKKLLNYFDLGGLDYINNSSVANFKNDFGGKNIELLGKKIL